jgi:DNA polymerase I-like protein with 3'-5' exonuclease and polymerase domains
LVFLPEPKDYFKYWYIDIEADGLYPSKLWLLCASRMDQEEIYSFIGHDEIRSFFDGLRGQEIYFVGHNAISYDGPHTKRLVGGFGNSNNIIDTLILSYLYDPALTGGHSLEAWGERLKDPKEKFNDWSGYSEEMDKYCQQDVKLGKKVARALWQRMKRMGFSELSCEIEHQIREIVDEQQSNGWFFDIPGAQSLFSKLRAEQLKLETPIRELFPRRLAVTGTYKRRVRKDGGEFASFLRHNTESVQLRDNEDGTYSTLGWSEFNIGSPKQRVERLLELGWEPQNFSEKGFPKVDEESLLSFAEISGRPEAGAIAEWLVLQGRSTMVEGWLNNVNYEDHCMHGRIFTCGATTRRMIHSNPNTANVPKAKKKVKYGIECRQLWQARPNRREVGYDASGLEMRMFAEYLSNDEATLLFTTGDPHLLNTRNLELPDEMRDLTVKNGFYAYLYGAGDGKLGVTLKPELRGRESTEYGKWARGILEKGTPGLTRLVSVIQDEFRGTGGLLRTIDGGFVHCRSQNACLNYKLQSAGAIVMKKATIIAHNEIKRKGLDGFYVGNIHDEGQLDAKTEDAEKVGQTCVDAIATAGIALGFKVPLTGNYKVGLNWAECH